ncbi:sulfurtransferase TusA family protein [Dermatophilaceae bacterium Soc4.6]
MPEPQRSADDGGASGAMLAAPSSPEIPVFDGGDLACGELLLGLLKALTDVADGTAVRVVATDPAAPIDIPAWCHLTGHDYVGAGTHTDGRPCFDLIFSGAARRTRPGRPWHLDDVAPGVAHDPPPPTPKGTTAS